MIQESDRTEAISSAELSMLSFVPQIDRLSSLLLEHVIHGFIEGLHRPYSKSSRLVAAPPPGIMGGSRFPWCCDAPNSSSIQ